MIFICSIVVVTKSREYAIALALATGNYSSDGLHWSVTSFDSEAMIAQGTVGLVLGVGLSVYCFLVVSSLYRELGERSSTRRQTRPVAAAAAAHATLPQQQPATTFSARPEIVVMPGPGMGYDAGLGQAQRQQRYHPGFALAEPNLPPGVMRMDGVNVHQQQYQQDQFGQLRIHDDW
jgi:hypothetical protein